MGAPASQRISANRVALAFGLLIVAWLVFIFWPEEKPPEPEAPVQAESKLRSVGLPDNVDLEGLPEFFTVWADTKEVGWLGDQAFFQYWNPARKDYSYSIRVIRTSKGYHFSLLSDDMNVPYIPPDRPPEPGVFNEENRAPTHPFDFSAPPRSNAPGTDMGRGLPSVERESRVPQEPGKVVIEIKPDSPLQVPAPMLKTEDSGGKK